MICQGLTVQLTDHLLSKLVLKSLIFMGN